MVRWTSAVFLVLQPLAASAADRCGGARLAEGNAEILVLVEQNGSEEPVTTHVGIAVVGLDAKMRFSGGYEETSNGQITPRQFFIYSSDPTASAERRETIRWRRDEGDWHTLPLAFYGNNQGEFSFQVAQKGPNKGTSYHTEHLDQLRQGGRFTVTRLSDRGEELVTRFLQYPNEAAMNALFKRAKIKALATLKPGCKSAGFVSPSN